MYPQLAGPSSRPRSTTTCRSLTEDSFPGVLANVIAGRIANRLDLGGVNYTVDAACASSLAALDVAVKELLTGAERHGAVRRRRPTQQHQRLPAVRQRARAVADGRCRTFDADADGITSARASRCLVLKRLADAERDGDRIYAV
jgi:acyl transferase domain-containing protein